MADVVLWINGAERSLRVATLAELVAAVVGDEARSGFAAALNDAIVPRSEWRQTRVRSGDRVEIVGAVAGG